MGEGKSPLSTLIQIFPSSPIHHSSILASQNAQIQALCTIKDIMLKSQIIMALKLKIAIQYIIDMVLPVILVLPFLFL